VSGGANAVGLAGVRVGLDISSIAILELCFLKGDSLCTFDSEFVAASGVETESGEEASTSAGFVGVGEAEIVLAAGCSDFAGVTL